MYRDDVSRDELQGIINELEAETAKLKERLHYAGLDLPDASTLPVWVAPYINWWGTHKGSECPGCGAQRPSYPRVYVHGCDFIKGDHIHVGCMNCREVSCWREKRT